jgi:hypothetical protein
METTIETIGAMRNPVVASEDGIWAMPRNLGG